MNEIETTKLIHESSRKYDNLPIEEWPKFDLFWDLNSGNYRFALDDFNEETFQKHFPDGLIVGWVDFDDLDKNIAQHCRRPTKEIWTAGAVTKLSNAISYLVEGKKMTPLLVCLNEGSLIIGGGYHRFAICIAKKPKQIPILVIPFEKKILECKLRTLKFK